MFAFVGDHASTGRKIRLATSEVVKTISCNLSQVVKRMINRRVRVGGVFYQMNWQCPPTPTHTHLCHYMRPFYLFQKELVIGKLGVFHANTELYSTEEEKVEYVKLMQSPVSLDHLKQAAEMVSFPAVKVTKRMVGFYFWIETIHENVWMETIHEAFCFGFRFRWLIGKSVSHSGFMTGSVSRGRTANTFHPVRVTRTVWRGKIRTTWYVQIEPRKKMPY